MVSAASHHAILRLRVSGGFLDGVDLRLVDGLNCIIGGRGTGKTTALEFLRFAFSLAPDPKTQPQRARLLEQLLKSNLPSSGVIHVEVRTKSGNRYTAERRVADSTTVKNELGNVVTVTLEQLIGADVFSLNQIEEIAIDPSAQLQILDRFVEGETLAIERDLASLRHKVDETSDQLRRCDREIETHAPQVANLPLVMERLKEFVEVAGPDAQNINAAHTSKALRDRESQIILQLSKALRQAVESVAAARSAFHTSAEAHLKPEFLRTDPPGPNGDVLTAINQDVQTFELALLEAERAVQAAANELRSALEHHREQLDSRHASQDADYRALMEKQNEGAERTALRTSLQTSQAEGERAKAATEAQLALRNETVAKRSGLLAQMSELRDRRFALRQKVAAELNAKHPSLRVTVKNGADSTAFSDRLAEMMKGSGKYNVLAERVAQSLLPGELVRLVVANEVEALAARTGLETQKAIRVVETLRKEGGAYDLEAIGLDDVPCIELLDGKTYKQSSRLSTGQRCTTILPILLAQSERPLLVDQPEDNLDNRFIYEAIVHALRGVSGKRQIIFVTHNPNIPVLGEADRVFVMSSDGQQAAIEKVGTVDECKLEIETLLEGGRDAFIQRKERYGH